MSIIVCFSMSYKASQVLQSVWALSRHTEHVLCMYCVKAALFPEIMSFLKKHLGMSYRRMDTILNAALKQAQAITFSRCVGYGLCSYFCRYIISKLCVTKAPCFCVRSLFSGGQEQGEGTFSWCRPMLSVLLSLLVIIFSIPHQFSRYSHWCHEKESYVIQINAI